MSSTETFAIGLVELISPFTFISARGNWGDDEFRQRQLQEDASKITLANYKLLDLAIRRCTEKLFVTYSGSAVSTMRTRMSELYNTLWDLCIENRNMGLDCRVVFGTDGMKTKKDIFDEHKVDVVINAGRSVDSQAITAKDVAQRIEVVSLGEELFEELHGERYILYDNPREDLPVFPEVVLGGTFDRFHNGHKKLLTVSLAVCSKKLTVGVTSDAMLKSKKNSDMIEPIDKRRKYVLDFCQSVKGGVELDVVQIDDPWGPSIVRPELDAIVVSSETIKGARMINEQRKSRGLKRLEVIVILRSNVHMLSSSFIREIIKNEGKL